MTEPAPGQNKSEQMTDLDGGRMPEKTALSVGVAATFRGAGGGWGALALDRARQGVVNALVVLAAIGCLAGLVIEFRASPWSPFTTARHIAAWAGCPAARAVGLAPAQRGDPGYHVKLDVDRDGYACEGLIDALSF